MLSEPATVESEVAPSRSRRLKSIDALRGIAAIVVVLFHLSRNKTLAPQPGDLSYYPLYWLKYGYSGVGLFLVISGFCIHLPYARTRPEVAKFQFVPFWKRRLHRLYPPYCAAIFLGLFVAFFATFSLRTGVHTAWPPEPYQNWGELGFDVVTHLFMLHTLFVSTTDGVNNPSLWSLGLEEQLYFIYPAWLKLRRWQKQIAFAIFAALMVTLTWLLIPSGVDSLVWLRQAPARWFEWCLGAAAAEAYCERATLPRFCYWGWLGVLLLVIATRCGPGYENLVFGLGYFLLLNWAVQREQVAGFPAKGLLAGLAAVGTVSYSLYLSHRPSMQLGYGLLAAFHLADYWICQLLFIPIVICAGTWIFFHLIEKRFLRSV